MLSLFKSVKHFVFDIDGVLTNNQLLIHSDGMMLRSMHIKDGYALQLAVKRGYTVSIISGAKGNNLMERFKGLGIADVYLGIDDKLTILNTLPIPVEHTLYMGDDMPDIAAMKAVYLPVCPLDACVEVQAISKYVSPYKGGEGCVRDVIEKVLKLNGDWA